MMISGNKGNKGFTLVEMMVTIAIMAILLGITIATWNRYRLNTDLKTAARTVVSDFSMAKQMAVRNAIGYRITFNTGTNSYQLIETATGNPIQTRNMSEFGPGIVLSNPNFGGNTTISFFARGTAEAGSVVVTNSINSTGTITVNMTGRTYVRFNLQ